jgi:hypothetical protein
MKDLKDELIEKYDAATGFLAEFLGIIRNNKNAYNLLIRSEKTTIPFVKKALEFDAIITEIITLRDKIKNQPEQKTAQEFVLSHPDNKYLGFSINQHDKLSMIVNILDEYRKQGRYFTEDEIRVIQDAAYDAGFNADKT